MRNATIFTAFTLALALVITGSGPVSAATVVVPNTNTVTPGPSNQAFPFNQGNMRYQQVFAADQMASLSGVVTHIRYRVDESAGDPFTSNPIDTEIRLCHTTAAPNAMSLTFADNLGGDVTLVFDGFLNLSSAGNPNVFDITLDINDVFNYNGSQNLLVDIKVFGGAATTQFDAAGTGLGAGGTPWTDRVWATDVNALTGSSNGDDGYVTQFTIEQATAVESTSWGNIKAVFEAR